MQYYINTNRGFMNEFYDDGKGAIDHTLVQS